MIPEPMPVSGGLFGSGLADEEPVLTVIVTTAGLTRCAASVTTEFPTGAGGGTDAGAKADASGRAGEGEGAAVATFATGCPIWLVAMSAREVRPEPTIAAMRAMTNRPAT